METPKRMGRKCMSKKNIVVLILMKMKSSMEQEEENLKKEHFEETSINLANQYFKFNATKFLLS